MNIIVIDEAHLGVNILEFIINDLGSGHRVALAATPDDDLKNKYKNTLA